MYKSKVCRAVILCICELVINWSLFLVRNKSAESIYWDGTGRIFNSHSDEIFEIQKKIIRIIMNSSKNASCKQLFKELNILPIESQYIFSIILFVTKNKYQFLFNSQVYELNKRQTSNLYLPTTNLTIYQKGVYYSGIKIYNHLPTVIKDSSGDKNKFKLAIKDIF